MTSFILKLIAILLMLIDHTGAVLSAVPQLKMQYAGIFFLMRVGGRASFPIFAFLVAQGCTHTKNMFKYLKRIALFALVSEIPFNLFINFAYDLDLSIWNINNQNVFFTWVLAVFAVMIYQKARIADGVIDKILLWAAVGMTVISAELAHTDYGAFGVLLVLMLYIFRPNGDLSVGSSKWLAHLKQLIVLTVFLIFHYSRSTVFLVGALSSVVVVGFYNGRKGKDLKWLFYMFYPLHILILTAIGYVLR